MKGKKTANLFSSYKKTMAELTIIMWSRLLEYYIVIRQPKGDDPPACRWAGSGQLLPIKKYIMT